MGRQITTLLLPLWLASCLPRSGEVELFTDALPNSSEADAGLVSRDSGLRDRSIIISDGPLDIADGPLDDFSAQPGADQGATGGPPPPFGATQGMTAANFIDIPDCGGALYTLHDYYNKKKGVLIAMMSPSCGADCGTLSRWLEQQVQDQFPEVEILEVLAADFDFYQVAVPACDGWITTNGLSHPVLRDVGGTNAIMSILQLPVKNMLVVDQQLNIVFTGRVNDTFAQSKVLSALSQLP